MIALLRTEFVKAARRSRTAVIAAILVGLPALIVSAISSRQNRPGREAGTGLFRLSEQSGLLVPAPVLAVTSGFLLVILAGLLAGDSVAGDASWGNLRYVLLRPVGRLRLLLAKALVAGFLIWCCVALVTLASLIAGVILFGWNDVTVPTYINQDGLVLGFNLTTTDLLLRTGFASVYVAFGYTALLAMGTFFSTLTDAPSGAIGATVGVYIVSSILNGIPQLGVIRYGFPSRYLNEWRSIFTENHFSNDLYVGIAVQLAYLVVFGTAAAIWFRRKDIHS